MARAWKLKLEPHRWLLMLCIVGSLLALLTVGAPIVLVFSNPPSFLGLDVSGGVVSIEASKGPDRWWGPFDGVVAPRCGGRPFEFAVQSGEVVARQMDDGVEITLGSGAVAMTRCGDDDPVAAPANLMVIATDAVLPFAGVISVGQQVTDRQELFAATGPLSAEQLRHQGNPALVSSGEAWARTSTGRGATTALRPGDNVMFGARGANPIAYGALIADGKSLRTIARASGDHVSIRRWGQRSAERDLLRPSTFDRLQSAALWAWLAVVSAILVSVFSLWAAYLQPKIR